MARRPVKMRAREQRDRVVRALAGWGAAALVATAGACGGTPGDAPGPEQLTLEYRMITHFPTCRGNTRVKVDRDGKVWSMRSDKDCPRGVDFSAPYPDQPRAQLGARERRRLVALVVKGRFFELQPPARGPVQDGYREEIEVRLGGRQRTVVVHHGAKLDGWNELKAALVRHAP